MFFNMTAAGSCWKKRLGFETLWCFILEFSDGDDGLCHCVSLKSHAISMKEQFNSKTIWWIWIPAEILAGQNI